MKKNDKIFILGSGFVGTNTFKMLQYRGYYNSKLISRKELNLFDTIAVNEFFRSNKIDYIILTGAKVGGIQANMNNQFGFLYENLLIQNNVIPNCIKYNIKSVILGSSCIYPKDYIQPLKEEYLLNAPLENTNEGYSLAKITALKLCEYANRELNSNLISLMPCNIYGPNDNFDLNNSHVLSALIKKIVDAKDSNSDVTVWGTGEQRREFLYIDDLSDGIIWSLNNLEKTNTFLNIGTGIDISISELSELIADIVGFDGNIHYDTSKPNGMMKKCIDVSKINKLGWKSKTTLIEGLKSTIEYYKGIKNAN